MSDYRVLVINGGGVRGIVPAKILQEISHIAGKEIYELFDCIIGTSIGGIIAAALTVKGENDQPKYKVDDIVNLFLEKSETIFSPERFDKSNLLFPKYSREGLDSVLDSYLGNKTLTDTIIPIIMVSYSLDLDGPRVWSSVNAMNSKNYDLLLKDAAGATSAAPTYFPPKITAKSAAHTFHDVDGGIFANSPTFIGISELLNHDRSLIANNLIVVSIGTGQFTTTPLLQNYTEDNSSWSFSVLVSATAGISGGLLGFAAKGIIHSCCNYNIKALWPLALSAISFGITYASIYTSNFATGALGWVINGGLVDRMMQGSEEADVIASTHIFKTIRINPDFTKGDDFQYRYLDKSDKVHMQKFSDRMDSFIRHRPNHDLLSNTVKCLESRNTQDSDCQDGRILSHDLFGKQYHYEANKPFYYAEIQNSELAGTADSHIEL